MLCPPSLVFAWYEAIRRNYPTLIVYLWYGRDKDSDEKQYNRIESKDLGEFNGKHKRDHIRPDLRYIFDVNDTKARKVVIVSAYGTFRDRTGYREAADPSTAAEEDLDDSWMSNFRSCFSVLIADECQFLKNPGTKLVGVLADLELNQKILLTGTPMPNIAEDFATMLRLLWNHAWVQKRLPLDVGSYLKNKRYDPYKEDFALDNPSRYLLLHPQYILAIFNPARLPQLADNTKKVMNMICLRRTRYSQLASGSEVIQAGTSLPPIETKTIELVHEAIHGAEHQIQHKYLANEFIKCNTSRSRHDDDGFNFPMHYFRELSLLANSLAIPRLMRRLGKDGLTSLADDVASWRRAASTTDGLQTKSGSLSTLSLPTSSSRLDLLVSCKSMRCLSTSSRLTLI